MLLFFVFLIALRTAAGVNITLPKASSISGGVQVGCRPLTEVPTEPKIIFRTLALSKSSVSSLPLASMCGEIPLE